MISLDKLQNELCITGQLVQASCLVLGFLPGIHKMCPRIDGVADRHQ